MTDLPDIMPVEMDEPWPCRHQPRGCDGCDYEYTDECPFEEEEDDE